MVAAAVAVAARLVVKKIAYMYFPLLPVDLA